MLLNPCNLSFMLFFISIEDLELLGNLWIEETVKIVEIFLICCSGDLRSEAIAGYRAVCLQLLALSLLSLVYLLGSKGRELKRYYFRATAGILFKIEKWNWKRSIWLVSSAILVPFFLGQNFGSFWILCYSILVFWLVHPWVGFNGWRFWISVSAVCIYSVHAWIIYLNEINLLGKKKILASFLLPRFLLCLPNSKIIWLFNLLRSEKEWILLICRILVYKTISIIFSCRMVPLDKALFSSLWSKF